jgi:hypothetical protein
LILEPYLEKIPSVITAKYKDLKETEEKIVKDKAQINKAEQSIIDAEEINFKERDKIANM